LSKNVGELRNFTERRAAQPTEGHTAFVPLQHAVLAPHAAGRDNAQRLDVPAMLALMNLRARRNNRLALIFGAQLAKNEQLDEPMGRLFQQAKIDRIDCEQPIELKSLTEAVFYDPVIEALFADLETDFEDGLEEYAGFIATTLWEITAGDWKSINSRVKHFNRLLGPRASRRRMLTRSIVEQVLGRKLAG